MWQMVRSAILLVSVTSVGLPTAASRQTAQRECLAIGFGAWMPARPDWLAPSWWVEPPPLRLSSRVAASIHGTNWLVLGFAPGGDSTIRVTPWSRRVRAAEFLWAWRAPSPDSLQLIRFAALSVGLSLRGTWQGDTLRAEHMASLTCSRRIPTPARTLTSFGTLAKPPTRIRRQRELCTRWSWRIVPIPRVIVPKQLWNARGWTVPFVGHVSVARCRLTSA